MLAIWEKNNRNTRTVCFNFQWLIWGICYVKKALIWCKDLNFLKNHFAIPLNQTGLVSLDFFFFFFYWRPLDWWSETLPLISPSSKVWQVRSIPFVSFLSFQLWLPVLLPHNRFEESRGKTIPREWKYSCCCSADVIPHSACLLSVVVVKVVKSLSRVRLFETPWTAAYQAPQSMEFSRQEYWSGLPFPSPGDLPNPGIEPRSPALRADALLSEPSGKPSNSTIRFLVAI